MRRGIAPQKAALLYVHRLIGEGIVSLLEVEGGMEVVPIDAAHADAHERLKNLCPDVVIVEGDARQLDVLAVLGEAHDGLMIWVKPDDNTMEVYRNWQVEAARAEDLRDLILSYRKRCSQRGWSPVRERCSRVGRHGSSDLVPSAE